ncbi:MAG: rRNA maturation RNase YbeY [Rhodospirillales bacterium]|nr:rRNA maturation RNase YbeY [Rhodospirillales bacterium]
MTESDNPANPRGGSELIDIRIEAMAWRGAVDNVADVCRGAALAAMAAAPPASHGAALSVLLTDDATMQTLNRTFRGHNEATNVLSFASGDVNAPADDRLDTAPDAVLLGDIAIGFGISAREADEAGKPLADHLRHLIVHGVLHLLGYDHEDDADAERMERLETRILTGLGVPDPYVDPPEPFAERTERR